MKQALVFLLVSVILSAPASARADAWADLEAITKDFYLIDKVQKQPISCRIESSALQEFMDKVPAVGNMIEDQIRNFRVTAKPDGSITFVTPRINIHYGTAEGIQDVKSGLTRSIEETKKSIWRLLKGFMSPKKDEISNLSVSRQDGKTIISMTARDMDGTPVTGEVVMSGDGDIAKSRHGEETWEAENKYMKLDDKWGIAVQKARAARGQESVIEETVTVEYQQLGKVWFPSRLVAEGHKGPKATPYHVELRLADCTGS